MLRENKAVQRRRLARRTDAVARKTGQEVRARTDAPADQLARVTRPLVRRIDDGAAPRRKRSRVDWRLALACLLPVVAIGVYVFAIAADRYTSQAAFVIQLGSTPSDAVIAGGIARNDESSHAVGAFIQSRDATRYLAENAAFAERMSRPEADFLTVYPPFWQDASDEALHDYMRRVVRIDFDPDSGISTLEVTAFRPEDAQAIATSLLAEAEALVNRMNERQGADAIRLARRAVDEAEARVRAVQDDLTEFRNSVQLIDPSATSQSQIALLTRLTEEQVRLQTQIAALRASAPQNPRLQHLGRQLSALQEQIASLELEISGSEDSLAPKLGSYELLSLERELAVKSLASAYRSLEAARFEADADRVYLQTLTAPNLPDEPSHPTPLRTLAVALAIALAAYVFLSTALRLAREYR